jgi:hypothetical protein
LAIQLPVVWERPKFQQCDVIADAVRYNFQGKDSSKRKHQNDASWSGFHLLMSIEPKSSLDALESSQDHYQLK